MLKPYTHKVLSATPAPIVMVRVFRVLESILLMSGTTITFRVGYDADSPLKVTTATFRPDPLITLPPGVGPALDSYSQGSRQQAADLPTLRRARVDQKDKKALYLVVVSTTEYEPLDVAGPVSVCHFRVLLRGPGRCASLLYR